MVDRPLARMAAGVALGPRPRSGRRSQRSPDGPGSTPRRVTSTSPNSRRRTPSASPPTAAHRSAAVRPGRALGPSTFTAVHATHLTLDDIALLAASGTAVCLCPTTERDLADGIGPSRDARRPACRSCLGTRLARGHRPVRGSPCGRARRAPATLAAGHPSARRRCCRWRRSTATAASAGRDAGAHRRRGARRPHRPSRSTPPARRQRPSDALAARRVRRRRPPMCTTSSSAVESSSATATTSIDVAAELEAAIRTSWGDR